MKLINNLSKFQVGDRVRYVSNRWMDSDHNPLWDGEGGHVVGTVKTIGHGHGLHVRVDWDNGAANVYAEVDLEKHNQNMIEGEEVSA